MKFLLATILGLAITSQAQTAQVIALDPNDTAQAIALHKQLEDIQQKLVDFDTRIKEKYLFLPDVNDGYYPRDSKGHPKGNIRIWENGGSFREGFPFGHFEYSTDYKFIVPLVEKNLPNNNLNMYGYPSGTNPCITLPYGAVTY